MQAHRASFVATPTAELSNQEETLLGDILDWSLDTSCSGYEGDQEEESEGEKDGDSSMISIKLHSLTDDDKRLEHCRALSSDEDSFCEAEREASKDRQGREPLSFSSGYSSVQSVSPSSTCSSSSSSFSPLVPCTFKSFTTSLGAASANAQPGFRLLVPVQRPRGNSSKQVKRKNSAAHSGGEVENGEEGGDEYTASAGFLSL